MTDWYDRLRVGKAPPGANAFANQPPQNGAPTSPAFVYVSLPPGPPSNNAIALQQTVAAGGTFVLTAGSNTNGTVTIGGLTCIDLGAARVLQYVNNTASAVAAVVTVSGFEETVLSDGTYGPGQAMSEQVTLNASLVAKVGKKSFRYIQQVFTATNTVSGASIGVTDNFGVPVYPGVNPINAGIAPSAVEFYWNGAQDTTSAHYTLPDTTSPATSLTGDVRGTYSPTGLGTSTGARQFGAWIFIANPDTLQGVYGVAQA